MITEIGLGFAEGKIKKTALEQAKNSFMHIKYKRTVYAYIYHM